VTALSKALLPLAEDSALIDAGLDFAVGKNATAGVGIVRQT